MNGRWNIIKYSLILLLGFAVILVGLGISFLHQMQEASGTNTTVEYLYIEPGSGVIRVAWKAEQQGLVSKAWRLRLLSRYHGFNGRIIAGEYEIAPNTTLQALLVQITEGKVYQRRLVVPEGFSSQAVLSLIDANDYLDHDVDITPAEGSLLPETYFFSRGDKASALIKRMQVAQEGFLAEVWPDMMTIGKLKTADEILTLASIIEKETGLNGERNLVSAVFHNRLNKRMRLDSDPTVIYGIVGGGELGRPLKKSELKAVTDYNTYRIYGLPPTPIANPGKAAIEAALSPAPVDYLYFVADGKGGHRFAETLREHNANVRRWRRDKKK